MKSLVQFIQESKIDYKKITEAVKKAVEILKKENKEWSKYAEQESSRVREDDYERFEDRVLNDHTVAPAIWKLVEKTAEILKVDAEDLFEEEGLEPFFGIF